jgi:hypothetical protein
MVSTKTIINDALDWERRSGATFEAEKTAIIHFTRKPYKSESEPFNIKGQEVQPKNYVKILGVVMDAKIKYKEHIARASSKGLEAALELKRLRGLSPATARQLFTSTVAPNRQVNQERSTKCGIGFCGHVTKILIQSTGRVSTPGPKTKSMT